MNVNHLVISSGLAVSMALLTSQAKAAQIVNIPCREHQDSYQSLVDGKFILVFGGRSGPSLDKNYIRFLGYTERMTYTTYDKQSWGYCKLLRN